MSQPTNPLPMKAFSSLLPALAEQVHNLAVAEQPNIEEAAMAFRDKMAEARALIERLPGGDLSLSDQDEVIKGLKELKQSKLMQLAIFKESAQTKVQQTPVEEAATETAPE
ncbi:hypothetical protein CALCODRAFT_487356 [Calocera cornea HHB12733]|uniref:Mediator of RNA polymerase II transcription subunit 9 n=1 Tax=Calocera cornea HHB12733 TaxID=1353952 RepID=A0A165D680_9BASI|nr:hypothetical protein CALCODRAFT_487356 [Calocera cornea HHB12733]